MNKKFHYALIDVENAKRKVERSGEEGEYQYGVTYTGINHGGHHIEWVEPTGDAEVDKETLQRMMRHWGKWGQAPKIVRRRVSQPEEVQP